MGSRKPPTQLSEYFAYLEARYGDRFSLDVLTDEELSRLAGLGAQALERQDAPDPIGALLSLIQGKLELRARNRLINSRLSS
jgi:hypothetical protein